MIQARSLWARGITVTEVEVLRKAIADIDLDEYLNVIASALDIIILVAGRQSAGECLKAFRVIQGWSPALEEAANPGN